MFRVLKMKYKKRQDVGHTLDTVMHVDLSMSEKLLKQNVQQLVSKFNYVSVSTRKSFSYT